MDVYKTHIDLLGYRAKDKVTGFTGVIESVCFDLYGCVQASLKPVMAKDGTLPDEAWFDVTRLEINEEKRVVGLPNFCSGYVAEGNKGAASKTSALGYRNKSK